ncbi:hypothetical protein MGYG_04677 [Nannizzia gypsea CBS 118893]|uniref:Zn(2)-C6 fungal-type domain-containing protein n=1 Tax=Arthroderma gypseum (strain ATCC MYA-4604 / CBS 118893) TaxID=535722 RepID=E4UW66_ARTGP|nr:hypothetical protein MGYG_04677 [Nannizzia gypsea CBS 118893]EFR01674.1 hypothetical protein MGYG_04677 [Nannizzia gypsea CBS 118893]
MTSRSDFQSLRSSCERCRFQKLKCTPLHKEQANKTPQCERCARAKVECVFSRRAQGRRHSQNPPSRVSQTKWKSGDFYVDTLTHLPPASDTSFLSPDSPQISPALTYSSSDSHFKLPVDESSIVDANGGWPSFNGVDFMASSTGPDWLVEAYEPRGGPLPNLELEDQLDMTASKVPGVIVRLSALVIDINDTVETLQGGQWASLEDISRLEEYPIGSVLQLSQQLTLILEDTAHAPPAEVPKRSAEKPISESENQIVSESENNMPTQLLILSCYSALTNLYTIVLTHFEAHIRTLPENTRLPLTAPIQSRELRLGELPSTDDTWSKICTAVRLLLATLQYIEHSLGIPNSQRVVKDIFLIDGSPDLHRGVIGDITAAIPTKVLVEKVQSLKVLLRERINL